MISKEVGGLVSLREEKRRKRAMLLQMMNDEDWLNNQEKVKQIQTYVKNEMDSEYYRHKKAHLQITEKKFLYYVYRDYEYEEIRRKFGVTKGQLNAWRIQHGYYQKQRKLLKEEYVARFVKKGSEDV